MSKPPKVIIILRYLVCLLKSSRGFYLLFWTPLSLLPFLFSTYSFLVQKNDLIKANNKAVKPLGISFFRSKTRTRNSYISSIPPHRRQTHFRTLKRDQYQRQMAPQDTSYATAMWCLHKYRLFLITKRKTFLKKSL